MPARRRSCLLRAMSPTGAFYAERHETHPLQNRTHGDGRAHRLAPQERGRREWSSRLLRVPRMRQHVASCERHSRRRVAPDGRRCSGVHTLRPPSPYVLAQYDRERLYEEVWSEPTQKVARKYGISDVALSKVCTQLDVPKPPREYWAKTEAGRADPPDRSSGRSDTRTSDNSERRHLPSGNTRTGSENETRRSAMTFGSGSQ